MEEIRDGSFRLSQSRLKTLISDNPEKFLQVKKRETSESQLMGILTETLLLEGEDVFNSKYIVLDAIPPPKGIKAVIDTTYNIIRDYGLVSHELSKYDKELLEVAKEIRYQPNWYDETKLEHILQHQYYFEELLMLEDKQGVTGEMYSEAYTLATMASTRAPSKDIFDREKHILLPQYTVEFEYRGIKCMGILDAVVVNIEKKTINVLDVKVTEKSPKTAAMQYRWDIQGCWYHTGLKACLTQISEEIGRDVSSFEILNPQFLVLPRFNPEAPRLYHMSNKDLYIAQHGATRRFQISFDRHVDYKETIVLGIDHLIDRFRYHTKNDEWNYPYDMLDGKAYLNLMVGV